MIKRHFWLKKIDSLLSKRSLLWLHGVRRSGKTFLLKSIPGISYYDCEIIGVKRTVQDEFFLRENNGKFIALDEIHRLDDPARLLKVAADHFPKTKIIATGSSTLEAMKRFRDTLTGRKYSLRLTPMVSSDLADFKKTNIKERMLKGGLPPFLLSAETGPEEFSEWVDSFWAKDIMDLFRFEKRHSFIKFMELLFSSSGGIFEATSYTAPCEISRPTVNNYLAALEATSIVSIIKPFSTRKSHEITGAPKIYAFDTGFVCHARDWSSLRNDDLGDLWEHLVLNELISNMRPQDINYWRDTAGHEVDFVTNKRDSQNTIECKWNSSAFSTKNLSVFRNKYPRGINYLVSNDIDVPRRIKSGGFEIQTLGLSDIASVFG
jgi:predicted AAA+ superfamily ATPase